MKGIRTATATLAPAAAAVSALTTLTCCLPWGIGAALGALGLSVFVARFQLEFIILSVALLGVGLVQIVRLRRSCRRRSRTEIAVWGIAAVVVVAVVLFPEWVASLLAAHHRLTLSERCMAKKYWMLLGIGAVALVLLVRYFAAGHGTPSGQPQLLAITPQSLPQFIQDFNRAANAERVVLLMSPTCPVCLDGSSRVEDILQRHQASNIRVFAVWEPMLPTDWDRPNAHVLARLSDSRVIQVWDRDHLIAALVQRGAAGRRPQCCNRNGVWWDVIATYRPGSQWSDPAPRPDLLSGTIVRNAPQLDAQLWQHS